MSEILVIASDGHFGDSLMVLPAICGLAEKHDTVWLAMRNRQILEIADLPPNVIDILNSEPQWAESTQNALWLAAGAACDYDPGKKPEMSLIHRFMLRAGLEPDLSVLPQPKIKAPPPEEYAKPNFDILVAPWTTARERTMTQDQMEALAYGLEELGRLLVVGGPCDPMAYGPCEIKYGVPFGQVASLMQRAKCVVTVDSFGGRLAHAAGVGSRHIILDSGATPWITQAHPGAIQVKGRMEKGQALWNIEDIVAAVKAVLG